MNSEFNPLEFPILLELPRHLTSARAWIQHIPFAFIIMEMLKPRVLVELGTHTGVSYCAFCQATDHLGLETQCYAVDTWEGDEHSQYYGPEIYEELKAYHDPLYGRFSKLLKCRFDEALQNFEKESVDLLHIDGFHTYDAVKHDFENWLPKMSARGVILFHDTDVRDRNFGVWRLWSEICERFPSFEFKHGHGLGVLIIGQEAVVKLQPLLQSFKDHPEPITAFFCFLGDRIAVLKLLSENGLEIQLLQEKVSQKDMVNKLLQRKQKLVVQKEQEAIQLKTSIVQKEQEVNQLKTLIVQKENFSKQREDHIVYLERKLVDAEQMLNVIYSSISWRITYPLRVIYSAIHKFQAKLK